MQVTHASVMPALTNVTVAWAQVIFGGYVQGAQSLILESSGKGPVACPVLSMTMAVGVLVFAPNQQV